MHREDGRTDLAAYARCWIARQQTCADDRTGFMLLTDDRFHNSNIFFGRPLLLS